MMTDFRLYIRARLGRRLGISLDRLVPVMAAAQARRGGPAASVSQDVVQGPGAGIAPAASTMLQANRSAPLERDALAPLRALAERIASESAAPAALARPVQQPRLRLVSDRDSAAPQPTDSEMRNSKGATLRQPTVSETDLSSSSRTAAPQAESAPLNARPQQETTLPSPLARPVPSAPAADPITRSDDMTASPDHIAGASLPAFLHSAVTRRATPAVTPASVVPYPKTLPVSQSPLSATHAPLPALTAAPRPTMTQANVSDPTRPQPIGTEGVALPPLPPRAVLDRYLPRRTDRVAPTPAPDAPPLPADDFAYEDRLRAVLGRLLRDDMRRHGLHPEGEV